MPGEGEQEQTMGAVKEGIEPLYDTDFYGWTEATARALRARDWRAIDVPNLIEEVESMGRSERRELESRLKQLMAHLLKWQYQWLHRSRSWTDTITEQRASMLDVLRENPSLRPKLPVIVAQAYRRARLEAELETGIPLRRFPETCPYTAEQLTSDGWLPPAFEPDGGERP
jgi:hypothetical protein